MPAVFTTLYNEKVLELVGQPDSKHKAGVTQELAIARQAANIGEIVCYHDIAAEFQGRRFQIDLLFLLPGPLGIVCEVKFYKGLLASSGCHDLLIQHVAGVAREVSNPVPQVMRAKQLFEGHLEVLGIQMPIAGTVIMAGSCMWSQRALLGIKRERHRISVHSPRTFFESLRLSRKGQRASSVPVKELMRRLHAAGHIPIIINLQM